jgi:XTP/dITP diphosphohydrolase
LSVKLVLATRNPDKLAELVFLLQDLELDLITLSQVAPELHTVEDGKNLEENARKKAVEATRATGLISLAEDTGLEIEHLDGAPGRFAARFAGEKVTYDDNVQKVLKLMQGVPEEKRRAQFRCICAVALPDERIELFEGICTGRIATAAAGERGFGYDPIFIPDGFDRTFAQLGIEVKNRTSHRAHAVAKAKVFLIKIKPQMSPRSATHLGGEATRMNTDKQRV